MSGAGTAVAADVGVDDSGINDCKPAVAAEDPISNSPSRFSRSRFSLIAGALLDSLSFALFYLPFSSLTHLVNAAWRSLLAEI